MNREQAERAARILMRHPHIHGVELFGSVARDGYGNDLDLILVTDEEHGADFICEVRMELEFRTGWSPDEEYEEGYEDPETFKEASFYNGHALREEVAQRVLGNNFRDFVAEVKRFTSAPLDIFVLPPDWRDYLRVLQEDLPHKDPHFMENIARDAMKIA